MSNVIRFAEVKDIPCILRLQHKIHKELELDKFYPFIDEDFFEAIAYLIKNKQAIVAEASGKVVACIGFTLETCSFNRSIVTASEIGWSVEDEFKKTVSLDMYEACVKQAGRRGAKFFKGYAPTQVPQLATYYKRKKYTKIEESFIKEI